MTIPCLRTSSLWLILKELAATILTNFTEVCVMVVSAVVATHHIAIVCANREHAPIPDIAHLKTTTMISTMIAITTLSAALVTITTRLT